MIIQHGKEPMINMLSEKAKKRIIQAVVKHEQKKKEQSNSGDSQQEFSVVTREAEIKPRDRGSALSLILNII